MPTSLGQCYHPMIFPSKEVADGKRPDKKGLLFTIGGFILIAGTIVLVVKNSLIFFHHVSEKAIFKNCISYVAITQCPTLLAVCNQQRTLYSAH